jgi:hypothetical protein
LIAGSKKKYADLKSLLTSLFKGRYSPFALKGDTGGLKKCGDIIFMFSG